MTPLAYPHTCPFGPEEHARKLTQKQPHDEGRPHIGIPTGAARDVAESVRMVAWHGRRAYYGANGLVTAAGRLVRGRYSSALRHLSARGMMQLV